MEKKLNAVQRKAIKITKDILYAQRNRNIKLETKHHIKLTDLCVKYNLEFSEVFNWSKKWLLKNETISTLFNGLV